MQRAAPSRDPPIGPGDSAVMASASALAARPATIDRPATAAAIAGVRDACEKLELKVFRTQMLVLLEKIVDRLQKEKALGQRMLGRRPGGLPDRQKYLHKVSDSHPEKSLRADAYQMVDALLDLVWPVTNANGTERARKSRGGLSRDERIAKRKADHDAAFEAELEASSAAFEAQLQAEEAAFEARLQAQRAARQAALAAAPPPPPPPPKHWRAHPRAVSTAVDARVRTCPKKVILHLEAITQCACCGGAVTKKPNWGIGSGPLYSKDHKTYLCRKCTPGRWKSKNGHPWFSYTYRFRPVPGCTCDGEYVRQSASCPSESEDSD